MKKIILTFCFAVTGMLTGAFAQTEDISPDVRIFEDTIRSAYYIEDTIELLRLFPIGSLARQSEVPIPWVRIRVSAISST